MADSSQRSWPGGGDGCGGADGGSGGGGLGGGYATSACSSASSSLAGVITLLASWLGRQLNSCSSRSNSDHQMHTREVLPLQSASDDEPTAAVRTSESSHASKWPRRITKRE